MGSRIVAGVIVLAGVAALLWVAFGGNSADTATPATTAAPSAESDSSTSDNATTAESTPAAQSAAATSGDGQLAEPTEPAVASIPEPENFGRRMDLVDLDGWLNTDATSIDDFNGQVILVEMWTFGCFNCKARIPFNQGYYEQFGGENFEIVGVHAPEFSFEADVTNIENALVDLGVTWPVALDTEKKNFRAWQPGTRSFWPRTYVIDQNGDIRYDHIGEGKYEELRETIQYLLDNPPPPATTP